MYSFALYMYSHFSPYTIIWNTFVFHFIGVRKSFSIQFDGKTKNVGIFLFSITFVYKSVMFYFFSLILANPHKNSIIVFAQIICILKYLLYFISILLTLLFLNRLSSTNKLRKEQRSEDQNVLICPLVLEM